MVFEASSADLASDIVLAQARHTHIAAVAMLHAHIARQKWVGPGATRVCPGINSEISDVGCRYVHHHGKSFLWDRDKGVSGAGEKS